MNPPEPSPAPASPSPEEIGPAPVVGGDDHPFPELTLLHRERTPHADLCVYETADKTRFIMFSRGGNEGCQTLINLTALDTVAHNYIRAMIAATVARPQSRDLLIIGLGGGSLPMLLQSILPDLVIDAVEIDAGVIRVAERHFGLQAGERLRIHEAEGRSFVQRAAASGKRFDVVMLDVCDEYYTPGSMMTREFLEEVKAILVPDGLLISNIVCGGPLMDRESATYAAALGTFQELRMDHNRLVLAKLDGLPSIEELQRRARSQAPLFRLVGVDVDWFAERLQSSPAWDPGTAVLTDQDSDWLPLRKTAIDTIARNQGQSA